MKRMLLTGATLLLCASTAFAQTSTSTLTNTTNSVSGSQASVYGNPIGNGASSSISGATANTQSNARSNANATSGYATARTGSSSARTGSSSAAINVYTAGSGGLSDPSSPSDPSGGGDPTINYTGGYTVRNVPDVVAPSIIGGNPCTIGASGGLGVSGFGITGGATWADRACERRQNAALLYNIGKHAAAVALLCQDEHVRDAIYATGEACVPPRVAAVASLPASGARVAVAAPQLAPRVIPQLVPVRMLTRAPARPDWCDTVSGPQERARYLNTCRYYQVVASDPPAHQRRRHVS